VDGTTSAIDVLDARLLGLMTDEPRVNLTEVARRLGVARGTVHARLDRLVERGAIRGFGPELDLAAIGYPILAFVSLEIVQGRLPEAVDWLRAIPEVLEAHGTTGQRDLLCRVAARDPGHLQDLIGRMLGTPAVRRSTSQIALSEQIAYRTRPLLARAAGR
jgi:DNA-binding Lrp family transcriptional regulator